MGTTETTRFQMGDKVVHAAKPEWGIGVVSTSAMTEHEGTPCQRLVIRFDRAGLKTLSTAIAEIKPAAGKVGIVPERDNPSFAPEPEVKNPILNASAAERQKIMTGIPERARDPFATPAMRLAATLDLYRFNETGASLVDWAVMQSGLSDPLGAFSRHELEEYFGFFKRIRDKHLREEVRGASGVDPQELVRIARSAPPEGQQALRRLNTKR